MSDLDKYIKSEYGKEAGLQKVAAKLADYLDSMNISELLQLEESLDAGKYKEAADISGFVGRAAGAGAKGVGSAVSAIPRAAGGAVRNIVEGGHGLLENIRANYELGRHGAQEANRRAVMRAVTHQETKKVPLLDRVINSYTRRQAEKQVLLEKAQAAENLKSVSQTMGRAHPWWERISNIFSESPTLQSMARDATGKIISPELASKIGDKAAPILASPSLAEFARGFGGFLEPAAREAPKITWKHGAILGGGVAGGAAIPILLNRKKSQEVSQ